MEKAQASNSHQKILKHSFFLFVFLLILGSLLLIVGLYTEVSET